MAMALTEKQQEAKWQAEHDASTLLEANKITGDSKRFDAAMAHLDAETKSIENLRKTRQLTVKKDEANG